MMSAAWTAQGLSHTTKIVLLSLADNANDAGVCWPSIPTVAKRCSLDERTVYRAIGTLEAAGHLNTESRPGRSTIYRIHPCQAATPDTRPPLTESQVPLTESQATPDTQSGTPDSLSGESSRILREPPKNPNVGGAREARRPTATRLPEDFSLSLKRADIAIKEGVGPEREFARFCDHWRAASGANARKHDWDAAWRNWCRKAADIKPGIRNGKASFDDRLAALQVPDDPQVSP